MCHDSKSQRKRGGRKTVVPSFLDTLSDAQLESIVNTFLGTTVVVYGERLVLGKSGIKAFMREYGGVFDRQAVPFLERQFMGKKPDGYTPMTPRTKKVVGANVTASYQLGEILSFQISHNVCVHQRKRSKDEKNAARRHEREGAPRNLPVVKAGYVPQEGGPALDFGYD